MTFVVESEKDLVDKVWFKIKGDIKPGIVFGLQGDLGVGKTTLVKGIAKKLGIKEEVTSPTFVIKKDYSGEFRHIDLYRFEKISKADLEEVKEWLDNKLGPTFVEWPERICEVLKAIDIQITLRHLGDNKREVELNGT